MKLGALITIDDIPEEMMKNHPILEADDKERLPMLSKNANKEKQIEHLVKIRKQSLSGKYMPERLKFALSWTVHTSRIALLPSYSYHFIQHTRDYRLFTLYFFMLCRPATMISSSISSMRRLLVRRIQHR